MDTVLALPPELLRFLVYVMGGAFLVTGAALLGVLAFLGRGVLARLQANEVTHSQQFAAFGRQLSDVKKAIDEDLHRHDVRIVKLEEWRRGVDRARGVVTPEADV